MWLLFAFISAFIVGIRDSFKKESLQDNDILYVLCLNTLFSAILFLPFIIISAFTSWLDKSFFYVPYGGIEQHLCSISKCILLIGVWICSYSGIKHLPLTISGIIAAFGPVLTVLGAMVFFNEKLNAVQWAGITLSFASLIGISLSGKKEGIIFMKNKYVWMMMLSTLFSATAALNDKFIMGRKEDGGLENSVMFIQSWYNIYQFAILAFVVYLRKRKEKSKNFIDKPTFKFRISIIMVSLCEVIADLLYDAALQLPDVMVSVLSMVRRGSVVVTFFIGALLFHEKQIKSKAYDLLLVILGMMLLFIGSK